MSSPAAAPAASPAGITGTNILQVGPVNPVVSAALVEEFGATRLPDDAPARQAHLDEHGDAVRVAVCSGRFGVDADLMARLPHLEAVISFGVGYDSTDVAQAERRGITVSNTPDVLNDCVADTALALYLDVLRRTSASDRYVRAGSWETEGNFPLTTRATGRTVGILGLGRIGQAIATRLEGFGCTIEYHNRHEVEGSPYRYRSSPQELASSVDVLIVAATGGPSTRGLVDATVLDALGPQGHLINISRGTVVDQEALVDALVNGRLAGAGLDVFADEPHVPQELLGLDQVVLLPHVASGTHETRADMAALVLENLRSYLATGTLTTPIR
ncbi:2-hydroxyacid dehydrogenase [Arthrobacter sp.]|uniref:2-hydroxyacid dehydrogenase n=1 Tax=Arthrobacter sp. TaxID=1667 RepID=UPI003A91073E